MKSVLEIAYEVNTNGASSVSSRHKNYMAGLEMSARIAAKKHDVSKEVGRVVKFY